MGMIYLAIKIPSALTMAFIFNILTQLKSVFVAALTFLGLFKPPPDVQPVRDYLNNFVLIVDPHSPSLNPTPVHVVTAAIRARVPIVTYGDFLDKLAAAAAAAAQLGDDTVRSGREEEEEEIKEEDEEEMTMCTVCLERLERRHEIRELYNCDHAFHLECLGTWVDAGHVTCPLCRAFLLPPLPHHRISRFDPSFRQRPISRVY